MLVFPDQTLGLAQQKSLSATISVAILRQGHRYSDMARGSPFFWLKIRALISIGWMLSCPPRSRRLLPPEQNEERRVQHLHCGTCCCMAARGSRSHRGPCGGMAKDPGTRPLPCALLLAIWQRGRRAAEGSSSINAVELREPS